MANKQGYTVLERYPVINYAIVLRENACYQPYVATWWLNEDDPDDIYWSQGHYFCTLWEAHKYISDLLTGAGYNIDDLIAEFEDEEDDIEDILAGDLEDILDSLL